MLKMAAQTGFLTSAQPPVPLYDPIASTYDMQANSVDLVDIGGAPMPTQNKGRPVIQGFIEKVLTVKPLDWDIEVAISYNAVRDDKTGQLEKKARSAGDNFQRHIAQQAYQALNDGDAVTNFGAGYDGLSFFNDAHLDPGGQYATPQDNLDNLTLDATNFGAVYTKAQKTRDDQGVFTQYTYDLLVVSPDLATAAWQITALRGGSDDPTKGNRFAGVVKHIVAPQLDSTAWILVASSEGVKPIIVVMRERPNLQAAWFDPHGPDGGMYYFKFHAAYNHVYGDWRLAFMGKS
jgi:phage major head subunit gpT-like protein